MRRALRRGELRALLWLALAVEAVVTAWLVLNPSPAVPTAAVLDLSEWLAGLGVPSRIADGSVVEFVLNVALFVPIGATLRLLVRPVPWWAWPVVGFVLSSAIELSQLAFLDARSATWRDVWANTIGLALGAAGAAAAVLLWRQRRRRPSRRMVVL